jgi:hypothetical protein
MVASIPRIQSAFDLFANAIIIFSVPKFELRHIFKGPVRYVYATFVLPSHNVTSTYTYFSLDSLPDQPLTNV